VALCVVLIAPFLQLTILAANAKVPGWARDFDCDGRVSIVEWYAGGLDHGWRASPGGPPGCREAFRYKDGMADVTWCEASPHCRLPTP
jgi:hypothetical protein